MYQRTLPIYIFTEDPEFEHLIKSVAPLPQFTHKVICQRQIIAPPLESGTIVIIDAPDNSQLIQDFHATAASQTTLIVCLSEERLYLLNDIFNVVDHVWSRPLAEDKIISSFQKILTTIKEREDALLTTSYLDTLINALPDLIWFKDARGSHLKINNSFCKTVNKTKEQILDRGHYYIWDIEPDEYAQGEYICLESEEIVLSKKESCLFEETVKCGNEMRKFKTYKAPIFDIDGTVMGTVGCAHDVTDLQNLLIELNILVESLPFAIMVTDEDKNISSVNQKFIDLFKLQKEEVIGQSVYYFMDENRTFTRSKRWLFEHGEEGTLLLSKDKVLKIHDEQLIDTFGQLAGHIYLFLDITIEYHIRNKLLSDANTDYLTQLNNRRRLQDFMRKTPCGPTTTLLLADLDNFKEVNDQYGHDEGDNILVSFANLLQVYFPSENLFRLGGDEFAIVIPETDDFTQVISYADRLLGGFNNYIVRKFSHTPISVSIGIASNLSQQHDFGELFKRADMALYESKNCGKSTYTIWQDKRNESR